MNVEKKIFRDRYSTPDSLFTTFIYHNVLFVLYFIYIFFYGTFVLVFCFFVFIYFVYILLVTVRSCYVFIWYNSLHFASFSPSLSFVLTSVGYLTYICKQEFVAITRACRNFVEDNIILYSTNFPTNYTFRISPLYIFYISMSRCVEVLYSVFMVVSISTAAIIRKKADDPWLM